MSFPFGYTGINKSVFKTFTNDTSVFNFGNSDNDEFEFEKFRFNDNEEDVNETMLETAEDFKKRIEKNKDNFYNKIKQQLIKNYDMNKNNGSNSVIIWYWSINHNYGYSDDDSKHAFDIAKKLFDQRGFEVKLEYWGSNKSTFDKSEHGWGKNKWKSFNSKIRIKIQPKN